MGPLKTLLLIPFSSPCLFVSALCPCNLPQQQQKIKLKQTTEKSLSMKAVV